MSNSNLSKRGRNRIYRMGLRSVTSNTQRDNGTLSYWDPSASGPNEKVVYSINMSNGTLHRTVYSDIDAQGPFNIVRHYGINPRVSESINEDGTTYRKIHNENNALSRLESLVDSYRNR